MKKIILFVFVAVTSFTLPAQITTPAASPFSSIEQKVGLTDVTLEYSRPSVKGREIFGNLVPFNTIWRTGANKNTVVTFSDDVQIEGQTLTAGSYAIFTKPGESSWEIIFYSDTDNWGAPKEWDESKVAASYYYEAGKDLKKAQEWINKAVSLNDKAFWMSRQQSLIYAKLGDNKNAIAAAKVSLAAAKNAKNAHYIKLNKDSLNAWGVVVD